MIYVDRKHFNIPFGSRIIGHYGDNCVETLEFSIGENYSDCEYILYIAFADGSINSILLEIGENNTAVWNVKAEHIFAAGIAYIQIKTISRQGEIWHSPKAAVEMFHSIDENNPQGERVPSLFEQLDEKINNIIELNNIQFDLNAKGYITKDEALELISESIDSLLLPLNKRLDGE